MKVTKVTSGDVVKIHFEDGHIMEFVPYYHGFGYQCEGMRRVYLLPNPSSNSPIFIYNSRLYRCGPQVDEHKIVTLQEPYTQQIVAAYWDAARDYLQKNYLFANPSPEDLWWPWRLVCNEGGFDVERLREGKAEFVAKGD